MSDAFNEIGNVIWPESLFPQSRCHFSHWGQSIRRHLRRNLPWKRLSGDAKHLWNRYVGHAMVMKIYRMKHLTPTYVTWDDHDYGQNDGGKDYRYKSQSKRILNTFFPREKTSNYTFGPGVSTNLKLGGMNFLF